MMPKILMDVTMPDTSVVEDLLTVETPNFVIPLIAIGVTLVGLAVFLIIYFKRKKK